MKLINASNIKIKMGACIRLGPCKPAISEAPQIFNSTECIVKLQAILRAHFQRKKIRMASIYDASKENRPRLQLTTNNENIKVFAPKYRK